MSRFAPRRPSPALVISLIALFVALGGTGYAALSLPKNSVGTKQLKKNAVIGSKIKKNSVTGSKVKDGSLTGADVKDGSLSGADINLGTLGTVPNATNAANAANATNATNATHATSADNANTVGGKSASDFASAGQGLKGFIVVDPGNGIVHSANFINGGSYTITEDVAPGDDQITFPFDVSNRVATVSTGSIDELGGTNPCFSTLNASGTNQVDVLQQDNAGGACNEEYTILVF
jgi:hypothetical protein